jgi:hypothetical protein
MKEIYSSKDLKKFQKFLIIKCIYIYIRNKNLESKLIHVKFKDFFFVKLFESINLTSKHIRLF